MEKGLEGPGHRGTQAVSEYDQKDSIGVKNSNWQHSTYYIAAYLQLGFLLNHAGLVTFLFSTNRQLTSTSLYQPLCFLSLLASIVLLHSSEQHFYAFERTLARNGTNNLKPQSNRQLGQ
jgi:hypothetical protein